MKNSIGFKSTAIKTALIATLAIGAFGCGNNAKTEDSKEVAEEHNEAKFDDSKREKDAQFLVNAAEVNMKEIHLARLARQSSMKSEVKDLGKMMEETHQKAMEDLKVLASKKAISIPATLTEDANEAYKKLSGKSGKDFDKEYCDMMVKGHKEAIEKFQTEASEGADEDVKVWAQSMLPVLRTHLDHAMSCQKKCENI